MTYPWEGIHFRVDAQRATAASPRPFSAPSGFDPEKMWRDLETMGFHEGRERIVSVAIVVKINVSDKATD